MPKRICVVGAGSAGLPSVKSCIEAGFDVVCYEKTDDIGGLWKYREEFWPNTARTQRSTVQNSSKEMNSYSDFPAPEDYPNYLLHSELVQYFKMYADHFNVTEKIKLRHTVVRVEPASDHEETGRWRVLVGNDVEGYDFQEVFDGVMLATGHHAGVRMPNFPGQDKFKGEIMHSQQFKHADGYQNKTAVVVGIGSSVCDAAVELS